MKELIPLLGDQAKLVPYPINCPVYIYKDTGDEEFGAAAVANGKVSGVFLRMRMNKALSSPELIYNIDLHAKEESDGRKGTQQSEVNHSRKSQLVLAKQLRLRNGCPVYVKCKDGRNYSPDDGDQFERRHGIVLGTCDIPLYDGRRNHSNNDFWYSVQFQKESDDKGDLSMIMHEISPDNVSFRCVSPSISKYTKEQTKGEPMSPIEKFENTAVTGDLDENVVLDLVKTFNPKEKTCEVKDNKAVSPPHNRKVGFENDRTYPPGTKNNANTTSNENMSQSKRQRQPYTQINERNEPQTSPPKSLNGYNRNDSKLDMSNMRTPNNNQENLNKAYHIITPTSSKRSSPRVPSFSEPLTNIGSNPNGRIQKNATNMSENNVRSTNPRPPPKDFEYHAVIDFATQKSLLFHVIVGKGGKNHKILMRDTSCFLSLGGDEDSSQIFVYSESAKNVEYGVGKCLSTVLRYLPVHLGPGSAGEVRWVYDNAIINYFRHNVLVSTRNGFDSRLSPVRRAAVSTSPNPTKNHLFRLVLPGFHQGEIQSIVIGRAGCNIELLLKKTGLSKIFVRHDDSSGNPYVEAVGRSLQVAESGAYAILEFVQNAMKRRIPDAYVTNGQFRASAEFV